MRYADVLLMYAEAKIELGRLTLLSLLASMMSVPVLMAPPVHKPTTIRPSRQPIRQHCAKCSVVSVVWSLHGKICAISTCFVGISLKMLSDTICTDLPVQPTGQRNTLRQATGFGRRLRHLTKTDFLLLKRWPTEPISSSMVNVSMMRRFIYGHCQVMMY